MVRIILIKGGEGLVALVYTESLKWPTSHSKTRLVRPCLRRVEHVWWDNADTLPGSDVNPCVWAVVEVCLGILGACLPTFPALFRWKNARNHRGPSRMPRSESADSSQHPVLMPDERRSGFKSGVGKEFLEMGERSESRGEREC